VNFIGGDGLLSVVLESSEPVFDGFEVRLEGAFGLDGRVIIGVCSGIDVLIVGFDEGSEFVTLEGIDEGNGVFEVHAVIVEVVGGGPVARVTNHLFVVRGFEYIKFTILLLY